MCCRDIGVSPELCTKRCVLALAPTCAAFTDSDPRSAVLGQLAACSGPSRFINCALHHTEVMLLQDTSCASANKSSGA